MSTVATAAAAGKALWPLISVVVVSIGLAGGALFFARHRVAGQDRPQKTSVAPVAATEQVFEPLALPSPEQLTISPAPLPATETLPPAAAKAHRPQDRLAAEVESLSRATRDLRAGRAVEALKALDEYRRKFPKGLLSEEQRAARAQALCSLGRFDEANARLAELAPQSPLAVRAKQFCDARLAAR